MQWLILQTTARRILRHKNLWILGALASFLGTAEETEILRNLSLRQGKNFFGDFFIQLGNTGIFSTAGLRGLVNVAQHDPWFFFKFILFFSLTLFIFLAIVYLSILAQANLILVFAQKIKHDSRLSRLLRLDFKKFWRMFLINVVAKIIVIGLLAAAALMLQAPLWLTVLIICTYFIFMLACFTVLKFAAAEVMVNDLGVMRALALGLRTFKVKLRESAMMAGLLILINLATILIMSLLFLIMALPLIIITFALIVVQFSVGLNILLAWHGFLAFVIVFVTLGFLSALSWGAWTAFYLEIKD